MSSQTFTQAIAELADLPEDAQTQVLAYIKTLKRTYPTNADKTMKSAPLASRYPLRGETYLYLDPFEPAVSIK